MNVLINFCFVFITVFNSFLVGKIFKRKFKILNNFSLYNIGFLILNAILLLYFFIFENIKLGFQDDKLMSLIFLIVFQAFLFILYLLNFKVLFLNINFNWNIKKNLLFILIFIFFVLINFTSNFKIEVNVLLPLGSNDSIFIAITNIFYEAIKYFLNLVFMINIFDNIDLSIAFFIVFSIFLVNVIINFSNDNFKDWQDYFTTIFFAFFIYFLFFNYFNFLSINGCYIISLFLFYISFFIKKHVKYFSPSDLFFIFNNIVLNAIFFNINLFFLLIILFFINLLFFYHHNYDNVIIENIIAVFYLLLTLAFVFLIKTETIILNRIISWTIAAIGIIGIFIFSTIKKLYYNKKLIKKVDSFIALKFDFFLIALLILFSIFLIIYLISNNINFEINLLTTSTSYSNVFIFIFYAVILIITLSFLLNLVFFKNKFSLFKKMNLLSFSIIAMLFIFNPFSYIIFNHILLNNNFNNYVIFNSLWAIPFFAIAFDCDNSHSLISKKVNLTSSFFSLIFITYSIMIIIINV